jgi:hypothetical protein
MLGKVKELRRIILRKLGLRPIDKVFRKLKDKGYGRFDTGLEVFGYTGAYHTMNYSGLVKKLHVWEISPECETQLKTNLPDASIKITDSYSEIERTPLKFDLAVIDNHQGCFGEEYCEHFEMLPKVFPVLKQEAVIVFNIIPDFKNLERAYQGEHEKHRAKRKSWYRVSDSDKLSPEFLLAFYKDVCKQHHYETKFSFIVYRNSIVSYMVMALRKTIH